MEIDKFQACPCHSGNKIKFCCSKDIIGDLDEILNLTKGKQLHAAIDKIDRVVAKSGPRDSLSTIKIGLLLSLNELEQAEQANQEFMQANPKHPMGFHHLALLHASNNRVAEAVDSLQSAMESITTKQVPVALANSFRVVGMLLATQGNIMAARAHLRFAISLRPDDEVLQNILIQTYHLPGLPILMRHEFGMSVPEGSDEWIDKFRQTVALAGAGRWRRARRLCRKLLNDYGPIAEIQRAVAVLSTWLGDQEGINEGWAAFADNANIPAHEALEARTYQLLLNDDSLTEMMTVERHVFDISDINALTESAIANQRFDAMDFDPEMELDDSQPMPKSAFMILDREPAADDTTDLEHIPLVVGELLVFGKQTDREARLELMMPADKHLQPTLELIQSTFGDWVDNKQDGETIGEIPTLEHALKARMKMPEGLGPEEFKEVLGNHREKLYLEEWPNLKFTSLGGKTPREVAGEDQHQLTLLALIRILEQSFDQQVFEQFDFNKLRSEMKLPAQETLDLSKVNFQYLSPVWAEQLPFDKLENDDLMASYFQSANIGNLTVIRDAGQEMLAREGLLSGTDASNIMISLAQVSVSDDVALEYAKKAREQAVAAGDNEGIWLVRELDVRLGRGIVEGCEDLVRVVRGRFSNEQEVEVGLLTVLQKYGLIGHPGQAQQPGYEAAEQDSPPAEESKIWTPDQGSSEQEGESKLWIPD